MGDYSSGGALSCFYSNTHCGVFYLIRAYRVTACLPYWLSINRDEWVVELLLKIAYEATSNLCLGCCTGRYFAHRIGSITMCGKAFLKKEVFGVGTEAQKLL